MTDTSDIYFINLVLTGKKDAFSHIVERHKDHAFNLALRICGNREDAEEIAQDSFIKAYRSLAGFKNKSTFSTWLYRIVYNSAISFVRSKRKGPLSIEDFPADISDFRVSSVTEDEAETEYKRSVLNFAMQKISEEDRGLVVLYYYDEMSIDEMSEISGISKSNLKVRLFRARHKMLEVIEKIEKKNLIYHE
jgi:RNA polymerase sigma factor (sigma-70 family)